MISIRTSGSFKNTEGFLKKMSKFDLRRSLSAYGRAGVSALAAATPKDSGLAAGSWDFDVQIRSNSAAIIWKNTDVETGFPVAIMLQYGYSTGTGGYVQGQDYINPALRPIMDKIADDVWKEVTRA